MTVSLQETDTHQSYDHLNVGPAIRQPVILFSFPIVSSTSFCLQTTHSVTVYVTIISHISLFSCWEIAFYRKHICWHNGRRRKKVTYSYWEARQSWWALTSDVCPLHLSSAPQRRTCIPRDSTRHASTPSATLAWRCESSISWRIRISDLL